MGWLLIIILIVLNGIFSLCEMALVYSRKSALQLDAQKGDKKAEKTLQLLESPSRFFSTIQIGITLIGLLTGLYSGMNFQQEIKEFLIKYENLSKYASGISTVFTIIFITYLSVVFGELLPKRIALIHAEFFSKKLSGFMLLLTQISYPLVWLLTTSTEILLTWLGLGNKTSKTITEEEIKAIVKEGTTSGEVQEIEQNIVDRVFSLGDRNIGSIMTPKKNICFMDLNDTTELVKEKVNKSPHTCYPIFDQNRDNIKGVIYLKDLFLNDNQSNLKLTGLIQPAFFIPESNSVYEALGKFKSNNISHAIVIDEFGQTQGIVTMHDVLEGLLGGIYEKSKTGLQIEKRVDGSYLIDGYYPLDDFLNYFDLNTYSGLYTFNTLSGLIFDQLKHVPKTGEKLTWKNMEIEIVDMDGVRIDKVIVKIKTTESKQKTSI